MEPPMKDIHGSGKNEMAPDLATGVDNGFGKARRLFRLLKPLGVRLRVNKLERINRYHFRVQLFKLPVIKQHRESLSGANAKVVSAVSANLLGFIEFTGVEVRFTSVALDEDILCLHHSLLRSDRLDSFAFFTEPGHDGCSPGTSNDDCGYRCRLA
jgi:hypothetical protein